MGGRSAGGRGQQAGRQRQIKYFPVVGDVRPYRGVYQGGRGGQMGDGENDKVRPVQHPEWLKRGSGIGTLWDGIGTDGLWSFPGDESQKRVYTQEASRFRVMATEAPSAHCGGVDIFYHKAEHFAIKETRLHGPNVIIFQLVTGRRQLHVVG